MNHLRIEHPARYYIFYLISRRKYRANELLAQLMRQGMPLPKNEKEYATFEAAVKKAQSELQLPAGFNPTDLTHLPTAEWLHTHHIYDMWAGEPAVTYAIDILDQPSIRRELEIMLLGPLNYKDIAKRLQLSHGLDPTVMNLQTVRYYAHYFWNIEALSMQQWPSLLMGMPSGDDYLAVFSAPRSQVGAAMSIYVATRGGGGIPKEQVMFRYVRDCTFMEFIKVAATRYPGMQKSTAMQALVTSLIASQEQVDMRRGGSAELLDELRRMETKFDPKKLTAAEELPLYTNLLTENTEKEGAS